jgi:hypothetical protein
MPAITSYLKSIPPALANAADRLASVRMLDVNGAADDYILHGFDIAAIVNMLPPGRLLTVEMTIHTEYLLNTRVRVKAQYEGFETERDFNAFFEPFDDIEFGIPWGWDPGGPLIEFTIVRPLWPEGV